MLKKSISTILFLTIVITLNLACGLVDQTADANKLVVEANGLIVQDNQQLLNADQKLQELFGAELGAAKSIETYKSANKNKFDELSEQFTQIENTETQITEKFHQASLFKLNDKYKQYLNLKAQEFSKEVESSKLVNPLIKSFMEVNDRGAVIALLKEYDAKSEAIRKEIVDLQVQSTQLEKDNPTLIQ